MKEGWMKNDEGWLKNDERWKMKDDDFKLLTDRQTNRRTDIWNFRVSFATDKIFLIMTPGVFNLEYLSKIQ